jgi:RNA polymerase sigma factor (sigma-70 family)
MGTAAVELPSLAQDRAFESLYRRYAKDVYHYALAVLRNPTDAEDVTQTTFLNAYRAIQRGEEPVKPQNWLIKIAHNAARSRYQRASRRVKEVPLDDHLDQLSVAEDDRPDVEAVLDALGQLPLNQRAALVMRELEGRTYAEIADTLGVSVAAVETLIFRARRTLRLKASSIRVLSVVPLPASLAQLLEGGGSVAVGGSAVAGYGFLFKTAVAVVAGVVATSIGGSHARRAQADPGLAAVASPPWSGGADLAFGRSPSRAKAATLSGRQPAARLAVERPGATVVSAQATTAPVGRATDTASAPSAATTTIASAQTSVTQATNTVRSAVSSGVPSTAVPSTPSVAVPQLPSVPQAPLPPPPPPPPLP